MVAQCCQSLQYPLIGVAELPAVASCSPMLPKSSVSALKFAELPAVAELSISTDSVCHVTFTFRVDPFARALIVKSVSKLLVPGV